MDIAAILALVTKGISIAQVAIEAGQNAAPALKVIANLVTKAEAEKVTEADIEKTEEMLDRLLAEFNADLPPAQPGDPDYKPPSA